MKTIINIILTICCISSFANTKCDDVQKIITGDFLVQSTIDNSNLAKITIEDSGMAHPIFNLKMYKVSNFSDLDGLILVQTDIDEQLKGCLLYFFKKDEDQRSSALLAIDINGNNILIADDDDNYSSHSATFIKM